MDQNETTAASRLVALLDTYTPEQHRAALEGARDRIKVRKEARRARARQAAARLRGGVA